MFRNICAIVVVYLGGIGERGAYAAVNCPSGQTACFTLKVKDTDATTSTREASTGQTLSMVVGDTGSRTADITATTTYGTFASGNPVWTGESTGNDGDATVSYSSSLNYS